MLGLILKFFLGVSFGVFLTFYKAFVIQWMWNTFLVALSPLTFTPSIITLMAVLFVISMIKTTMPFTAIMREDKKQELLKSENEIAMYSIFLDLFMTTFIFIMGLFLTLSI